MSLYPIIEPDDLVTLRWGKTKRVEAFTNTGEEIVDCLAVRELARGKIFVYKAIEHDIFSKRDGFFDVWLVPDTKTQPVHIMPRARIEFIDILDITKRPAKRNSLT